MRKNKVSLIVNYISILLFSKNKSNSCGVGDRVIIDFNKNILKSKKALINLHNYYDFKPPLNKKSKNRLKIIKKKGWNQ